MNLKTISVTDSYFSSFSGDEEYTAAWKRPELFTEIIVSPDMLAHHFPDALLDAIDELRENKVTIRMLSRSHDSAGEKPDSRISID